MSRDELEQKTTMNHDLHVISINWVCQSNVNHWKNLVMLMVCLKMNKRKQIVIDFTFTNLGSMRACFQQSCFVSMQLFVRTNLMKIVKNRQFDDDEEEKT